MTIQSNFTPSVPGPQAEPDTLNPWNPLDYLRVLWWDFFQPDRVHALWDPPSGLPDTATRRSLKMIQSWLVAGFVWLPYLLAVLAFGFAIAIPGQLVSILVPMLPAWVISITVTALFRIQDADYSRRGFLGFLLAWLPGLSMILWYIFLLLTCLPAATAGHMFAVVAVISAALVSSGVGYGIYLVMLDPLLPKSTSPGYSTFFLNRVKYFVIDWWTHAILGMFLIFTTTIGTRAIDQPSPLTIAAALAVIAIAYLISLATSRVISTKGAWSLAARASIVGVLVTTYAVMIWVLFLGGWRVL